MRAASNSVYGLTGEFLADRRGAVGMQAADLAAAVGVSRALVCLWERGRRVVDDSFAPAILAALDGFEPPDPEGWFWKHVAILGPEHCWEWQSYCRPAGYGQLTRRGAVRPAHRVSWELAHGPIPDGLFVCHHCDNPPCVNPAHLFVGTPRDNFTDMVIKGRERFHLREHPALGETNQNAKLTTEQVVAMRDEYAAGGVTQKQLAARYGISPALASFVVAGRAWQHVTHGVHARLAA